MNDTSDVRIEEMRVLVNLVSASCVKMDEGGGSRSSENGIEELASSTKFSFTSDNLVRSADYVRTEVSTEESRSG